MCSFFFNDTATTEIYTLSLHDALPIFGDLLPNLPTYGINRNVGNPLRSIPLNSLLHLAYHVTIEASTQRAVGRDRKSTRLNSSHANISYAVFCLKKKKHDTSTDSVVL